jgi:PAS domain S-box-containing protein
MPEQIERQNSIARSLREQILVKEREIRARWNNTIQRDPMFAGMPTTGDLGLDVLSTLSDLLTADETKITGSSAAYSLAISRSVYSLAHFYAETSALKIAIAETLQGTKPIPHSGIELAWRTLDQLFTACIRETTIWAELLFEQSVIGYCCFDDTGTILRANTALSKLLGRANLVGDKLVSLFSKGERKQIERAFHAESPRLLRRTKLCQQNMDVPVIVELGPLMPSDNRSQGYGTFIDISRMVDMERRTLDSSPQPMLRADAEFAIEHANDSALDLLGLSQEQVIGRKFKALIADAKGRAELEEQYKKRRSGQTSVYEIDYFRKRDNRHIPLKIHAWPEYDSLGQVSGSCGFLSDRTFDIANSQIVQLLPKHGEDVDRVYRDLALVLQQSFGADMVTIGIFSKGMTHWRAVARSGEGSPADERRWWPTSPLFADWLHSLAPKAKCIGDISEWVKQDPVLERNPVVKRLIEMGFRSLLMHPVCPDSDVEATISLWKKAPNYFHQADEELLGRLRVDKVVGVGLFFRERKRQNFLRQLIQSTSGSTAFNEGFQKHIAGKIARGMVDFYDWQHSSIFEVRPKEGKFKLLGQAHGPQGFELKEDYAQDLDNGLLGKAYAKCDYVISGDVTRDPDYKAPPEPHTPMRSELCYPVVINNEVLWLLNVEDPRRDAFNAADIDLLKIVVAELQQFLDLVFAQTTLTQIVQAANDGVVYVDFSGRIIKMNSSAEKMLGLDESAAALRPLTDFVSEHEALYNLLSSEHWTQIESTARESVELKDAKGEPFRARVQVHYLPSSAGHFVVFLEDLRQVELLESLEAMTGTLREIAMQTRLPLGLAHSALKSLATSADPAVAEVANRALYQMRKADRVFEGIVLHGEVGEQVSPFFQELLIKDIVDKVIDELSGGQPHVIDVTCLEQLPPVSGDTYQLGFVFESVLNFLVKSRPPNGRISVRGDIAPPDVVITCEGSGPFRKSGAVARTDAMARAQLEVALGRSVLARFVEDNHSGQLSGPDEGSDGKIRFRISLPFATVGRDTAHRTANGEKE